MRCFNGECFVAINKCQQHTEAYSEPSETTKTKLFAKTADDFQPSVNKFYVIMRYPLQRLSTSYREDFYFLRGRIHCEFFFQSVS